MIRSIAPSIVSAVMAVTGAFIVRGVEPAIDQLALAKRLIIPRLEFQDAWPSEAFDFIRRKSQELDPAKKGVNIVTTELPPSASPPKEAGAIVSPESLINFSETKVSVFDAVARAAKLSGLKVTAKKDGLIVHSAGKK